MKKFYYIKLNRTTKNLLFVFLITFISFFFSCKTNSKIEEKIIYFDKLPSETNYGYLSLKQSDNLIEKIILERTIYSIQNEFDLNGATLDIPKNAILKFEENGAIKNGTIIFDKSYLDGNVQFKNVSFSGTLINKYVNFSWFGANKSKEEENAAEIKNAEILTQVMNCIGDTLLIDGFFPLSSQVTISKTLNFRSPDWNKSLLTESYNNSYEPTNGFFANKDNLTLFSYPDSGAGHLNLFGIYVKGYPEKFINATTVPDGFSCAFYFPWKGSLGAIYNCKIEGFTQGIRALGGYIEKIQNTTFNACVVGVYALYASDFDVFGCKFTNCMPNFIPPVTFNNTTLDASTLSLVRQIGCGFMSEGSGMINFSSNLLENNFINFILNEGGIIQNISNCDFKNPTYCDLYFYNDYTNVNQPYLTLGLADLQNYCIDNIVVNNNNFIRSSDAKTYGECVVLFRNGHLALDSGKSSECDRRVTNIVFSNNTVIDSRTSSANNFANEVIFRVSNEKETRSKVVCSGNNFTNSKAKQNDSLMSGSTGKFTFVYSK